MTVHHGVELFPERAPGFGNPEFHVLEITMGDVMELIHQNYTLAEIDDGKLVIGLSYGNTVGNYWPPYSRVKGRSEVHRGIIITVADGHNSLLHRWLTDSVENHGFWSGENYSIRAYPNDAAFDLLEEELYDKTND